MPVNNNSDILDNALGTNTTINPGSGTTTLSTAQFQSAFLTFGSSLTGNCTIVFPVAQGKGFTIQHRATNSSLYTITLATTVSGGEAIACPPYEPFDIICDGTNIRFRNFGRIGEFVDYPGSSVPNWITACTIPPYLNCDGTTFSSATYPALASLTGTTLPDSRGRVRATLNQGQSRITSGASTGGVDGNTLYAAGGSQITTLSSQNVPLVPITDSGHSHGIPINGQTGGLVGGAVTFYTVTGVAQTLNSTTAVTGISAGSASPTNFSNIPPAFISGITMIRSA